MWPTADVDTTRRHIEVSPDSTALSQTPQDSPEPHPHGVEDRRASPSFVMPVKAGIQGCKSMLFALDLSPDLNRDFAGVTAKK